jgi:hypothetical protein
MARAAFCDFMRSQLHTLRAQLAYISTRTSQEIHNNAAGMANTNMDSRQQFTKDPNEVDLAYQVLDL